jgi:hypothetical protein
MLLNTANADGSFMGADLMASKSILAGFLLVSTNPNRHKER